MKDNEMDFLQIFAEASQAPASESEHSTEDTSQAEVSKETKMGEAEGRYAAWVRQAKEARAIYPTLDLERETQNPTFRRMLVSGVDVGTAYLACHKDEILPMAMQYAARAVEKKLMNKMLAGGAPTENGAAGGGAALVQSDVASMTRQERRDIIRRVARGEKIRF
ncbi:MAG: hypothetical protein IJV98_02085 [Clostridia bacterium]|nr:hypothetical protein [Clostridia bacterium]